MKAIIAALSFMASSALYAQQTYVILQPNRPAVPAPAPALLATPDIAASAARGEEEGLRLRMLRQQAQEQEQEANDREILHNLTIALFKANPSQCQEILADIADISPAAAAQYANLPNCQPSAGSRP